MKVIGFNHFQMDSNDVEKSRTFFETLGGTVVQTMERENGWKGYHVKLAEGVTIEIQPPRIPENSGGTDGWDHLALQVSDCEAACEMIVRAGGRIEKQPSPNMIGTKAITNAVVYGIDNEKIELIQEESQQPNPDGKIICGLEHMQLSTMDVQRSRKFYEDAFDGQVTVTIMEKDNPDKVHGYMVEIAPGSVIEIQPPRFGLSGKTSAWNTIAIETDDIEAACKKIEDAGGIREVGPMKGSMGTIQIQNAVIIGPSGEHVELIQII